MKTINSLLKYLAIAIFVVLSVAGFGILSGKICYKASADEVMPSSIQSIEEIASVSYMEVEGTAKQQVPTIKVLGDTGSQIDSSKYTIAIQYKKINEDDSEYQEVAEEGAYYQAGCYKITASANTESGLTGSATTIYQITKADISNDDFKFNETIVNKNSDDTTFSNTLTNSLGVDVVYDVTANKNITISEDGVVTLGRNPEVETEVQVSAVFSGNDNYNPKTVSYTLKVKNYYFITWKKDNADVGQVQKFQYGTNPTFSGTLQKDSTAEFNYVFDGWEPEIIESTQVVEDKTYIARFNKVKRSYTITFVLDDGTVLASQVLKYGEIPTCPTPTKSGTSEYKYEFVDWENDFTKNSVTAVNTDATYRAKFVKRMLNLKSKVDSSTGSSIAEINSENGIYEGSSFVVTKADEISFATPKNSENIASYSAKLVYGYTPIDLNGEKIKVTIKVEGLPSKTEDIKVAIKNYDGEVELIDVEIDGEYLTFETSKISDFMVVRDCGNLLATCLISVALILVVVMVLTVVFIPLLKRQDHSYSEDEEN